MSGPRDPTNFIFDAPVLGTGTMDEGSTHVEVLKAVREGDCRYPSLYPIQLVSLLDEPLVAISPVQPTVRPT